MVTNVFRKDESEKYTHLGYGKYKEKGKEDDEDSPTYKKTDDRKFVPFDGEEEPETKPKTKTQPTNKNQIYRLMPMAYYTHYAYCLVPL